MHYLLSDSYLNKVRLEDGVMYLVKKVLLDIYKLYSAVHLVVPEAMSE